MLTAIAAPTSALLSLIEAVTEYDSWSRQSQAERERWDQIALQPRVGPEGKPSPRLPTWKEERAELANQVQQKLQQARDSAETLLHRIAEQHDIEGVYCCEQRAGSYAEAALRIAEGRFALWLMEDLIGEEIAPPLVLHSEWEKLRQCIKGEIRRATRADDSDAPASALPKRAEGTAETTRPSDKLSVDERGVGVLVKHPEWDNQQIAEAIQCHPKSINKKRCPKLYAARDAFKSRSLPRGFKSAEGDVEAEG